MIHVQNGVPHPEVDEASVLSMRRSPLLYGPSLEDRQAHLEEIHLGAAMHNRGNVILGIYGMWHGDPSSHRPSVTMDLGLAISHDAMHFHEPIPGFRFIPGYEEDGLTVGYGPALMQGQGMENVDDRTLYWYSLWRNDGQVRLATWDRDRFGYVRPGKARTPAKLISCPIRIPDGRQKVLLNIDGVGDYAGVRVELLDLKFRPVPGYSGEDCVEVREAGLRVPVRWRGNDMLPEGGRPIRLQVDFGRRSPSSPRPDDVRFFAAYIGPDEAREGRG